MAMHECGVISDGTMVLGMYVLEGERKDSAGAWCLPQLNIVHNLPPLTRLVRCLI